ncbi:hypothetical protein [Gorillibacterium sp. CAU 1737]|uniref:hypothetical protein n=1 Tax=Gorillibacterium sp. CAU 1737 TaxID=3140362 RepID=UPI00326137A5
MEQGTMTFPENEYSSIVNRLNQGKTCYTTRVYKELGIYREGVKYNTPWNQTIVVIQIQQFNKIADHPFYKELTPAQREEIYQYSEKADKSYELIAFKLIEK